jgi:8-oxo-dGTP diphosphatase
MPDSIRSAGGSRPTPRHGLAVVALVSNEKGEILLIDGTRRGWELPGGQVEEGETLIAACVREVHEETGVEIEVERLAALYSNLSAPAGVVVAFIARAVGGAPSPSEESRAVEWVPRDHVLGRLTRPATYDRARELLAFDGTVIYRAYEGEPYRAGTARRI